MSSTPRLASRALIHQTFTVNTQNDTNVNPLNSTTCQDGENFCSLRAAIQAADNDYPNFDEIDVPAGYNINISGLGELNIYNTMFITGEPGGAAPIINGNNSVVVMDLYSNVTGFAPSVELTNLTIENGSESFGGDIYEGDGGSVNLTLSGTTVTGGNASSEGGGVYVASGNALWTDAGTVFSNNSSADGGAIFNGGQVFVSGSTFSGNKATDAGGAIYQDGGYIGDSATYSNNASPDGGVFYNTFSMSDSGGTYSGNNSGSSAPSTAYGSVLVNEDVANVTNATVTGTSSSATSEVYGGSFYNDYQLTLNNVSVSNSTNRCDGSDIYGGVVYNDEDNLTVNNLTTTGITNGASGVSTYIEGGVLYNGATASVNGLSASNTTDTGGSDEVFGGVFSNESSGSFSNLSISGTTASSNSEIEGGAGYNDSDLTLSDTFITSTNASTTAQDILGGALASGSYIGMTNVLIDSTTETAGGAEVEGALYTDSYTTVSGLTITNTTVNDVGGSSGEVTGGGWFNGDETSATNVQVLNTTVTADDFVEGGAFANDGDGSTITNGTFARTNVTVDGTGAGDGTIAYLQHPMTLTNVTMDDSTASVPAASDAYGIWIDNKIQFVNDTIANNTLTPVGGSFGANSGGFGFENGFTLSFTNTIVQFNGVQNCRANNSGIFTSSGGNIDSGNTCNFELPSDQTNVANVGVAAVADNGGSIQTAALEPGSAAIGNGIREACPSTDARGVARPANSCDVGAFQTAQGYYEVASDGGIFSYGAPFYGSMGGKHLNAPIVGMAAAPDGQGYWLVASDGGVFTFGPGAGYFGSHGGQHLNAPIVGIAATPDGMGYWLVASDGGVFTYGDAAYYGSMGGKHLNAPIVAMAADLSGNGYWLVSSDGGVFNFGPDAAFQGSAGSLHLNKPVVGITATPDGGGYWLVASDGGVFTYGDASYFGSMGGKHLNKPVVGMASTPDGQGYWQSASDGGIFTFGNAGFFGSAGGTPLNQPVVAIAAAA